MDTAIIDGRKLDCLRRKAGVRQTTLAAAAGVTKFTVSRWCSDGVHRLRPENLAGLARGLGMETVAELIAQVGVADRASAQLGGMTAAEREWLEVYRVLSPLDQARVRLAVERVIRGEA